ncbi:MAG: hypothetical protein U0T84_09355 [Chitinophagales bacterium]
MIYDPGKEIPGQPDYWQTIRFIYQHLPFHISEDEAYVITNLFVERWDELQGQTVYEQEIKDHVYRQCRERVMLFLSEQQIKEVVGLILSYLRSVDQYR